MNNAITVVQFPIEAQQQESVKIAKLFKDKVTVLTNNFNSSLAKLLAAAPTIEAKPDVEAPIAEKVNKTNVYSDILTNFSITLLEAPMGNVVPTGARKLKVNPIVSNNTKKLYDSASHKQVKVVPTKTELFTEAPVEHFQKPEVSFKEIQKGVTPVMTKVEPTIEAPAHSNMTVGNYNSVVSIDDYLQKAAAKDDTSTVVEELIQGNEDLKSKIVRSQTIVQQLEQQLEQIQQAAAKAKLDALQEERLSYTATLEGLTDKIRVLQEEINKESSDYGRHIA